MTEQWPVVGRGDIYYGGTTYENTAGLGAHLSSAAQRGESVRLASPRANKIPRPKENEVLAVPITKLYDMGTTLAAARLLDARVGEATIALNPSTAEALGAAPGERVRVSWNGTQSEVHLRTDESVAEGVALIPRSFGLAVREPIRVSVKPVKKVK